MTEFRASVEGDARVLLAVIPIGAGVLAITRRA
jgi:hypothetical protein